MREQQPLTMSDSTNVLLREFEALVGSRIEHVYRVSVTLSSLEQDLEQSIILTVSSTAGARSLQVLADGYEPRVRWMGHAADYLIEGDFGDRESDRLVSVGIAGLPVAMDRLVAVWQTIGDSATESILALLFYDGEVPRFTIVFDNDDILVGSAEVLWSHLSVVLSRLTSVRMEYREPHGSHGAGSA